MSKTLTRDQILQAQDLKTEKISCPEWGGDVSVRTMTGRERDAMEIAQMAGNKSDDKSANMQNFRARLAATCVVDDDGKQIFTIKDIEALGGKSSAPLSRIFDVAGRLNHILAEDVQELVGNSEAAPNDDSGSNSQAT